MSEPATAAEVARAIADALERHGLPYAIGGAIALGFYAVPRATVDVDVNIFVPPADQLRRALTALADAGFDADEDEPHVQARANSEGQFRGSVRGLRVDVFVPAFSHYAQLASRRRQVTLMGSPLWILSPEDLVVLKMMFFRRKDLADVEAVLRDQGASLDRKFVRRQLIELAGSEDERLAALDSIERDVDTQ
ncbi:MAG TPA: nucleotidyltransferase family protein [Candidatus Kryptonia bacterium]|nr:nucleotidyltransferase family protein [Candidatus Kryptonia bacterium]